eukprot:3132577-Amphidinium_carterae.1
MSRHKPEHEKDKILTTGAEPHFQVALLSLFGWSVLWQHETSWSPGMVDSSAANVRKDAFHSIITIETLLPSLKARVTLEAL